MNQWTFDVRTQSLALGYTMQQFFIMRWRAASLLRNFTPYALLMSIFLLYFLNDLLCLYHDLKFSNVSIELSEALIFSIVHFNFFKVNLILIFGHLKFIKVLRDKVFVCLLEIFHFDRVFTKIIKLGLNFFVQMISLCG